MKDRAVSEPKLSTELLVREANRLGLELTADQLARFRRYYEELVTWNTRVNLTTILEWEAVQVQHFLDSLTCVRVLPTAVQSSPYTIVDIGAGAGFPGVALKIALPHIRLTLVESVRKKAAFLQHLVQKLGLTEAEVLVLRAEEAGRQPVHREVYDMAVARAVAALPVLAEYMLPLVRIGGLAIAMKGREVEQEIAAAAGALALLGGQLQTTLPVDLPGLKERRHLVILDKVHPTPDKYPRRPGMPAKRPL